MKRDDCDAGDVDRARRSASTGPRVDSRPRRAGLRPCCTDAARRRGECGDARRALRRATQAVPQPRRHGAARLRPRRVPLLRLSAAAARRRACATALYPRARADRQPLERGDGHRRRAIPDTARRVPRALPRRRARRARRRCCCSTAPATTTACTRTSTASTSSRCRSAILLSEPERDFTGGEFVLTEQRPRMQSRAEVVPLRQGDAAVFAVHHRPVQGTRGVYRVNLRHGVSRCAPGSATRSASSSTTRPEPLGAQERCCSMPTPSEPAAARAARARRDVCCAASPRAEAPALLGGRIDADRASRAVSPHGHAGRLAHVGRDDQLRRARLGHRPQRLSLRRGRPGDAAGPGRRCPTSFAAWPRAPPARRASTDSCPTPA